MEKQTIFEVRSEFQALCCPDDLNHSAGNLSSIEFGAGCSQQKGVVFYKENGFLKSSGDKHGNLSVSIYIKFYKLIPFETEYGNYSIVSNGIIGGFY